MSKVYWINGHGSQDLDTEFIIPDNCSVTVKAKCGDYTYATVIIKECEKWLLTDKSELTEPYKMKLSKPFKNVITFGPGRSCKSFKLWLLNYQQPKLDSYFIILNKKPDISIFASGVFDHDSEESKKYNDMIITDANEYLNELFNKYLINYINPTDAINIYIDCLFGSNSILKNKIEIYDPKSDTELKEKQSKLKSELLLKPGSQKLNDELTLLTKLYIKKKFSYEKINTYITNYEKVKEFIFNEIETKLKDSSLEEEEKNKYITDLILTIIKSMCGYSEFKIKNIQLISIENLTIEDLCYRFPGDYYYFLCRGMNYITNKINSRKHGTREGQHLLGEESKDIIERISKERLSNSLLSNVKNDTRDYYKLHNNILSDPKKYKNTSQFIKFSKKKYNNKNRNYTLKSISKEKKRLYYLTEPLKIYLNNIKIIASSGKKTLDKLYKELHLSPSYSEPIFNTFKYNLDEMDELNKNEIDKIDEVLQSIKLDSSLDKSYKTLKNRNSLDQSNRKLPYLNTNNIPYDN